MRHTHDDLLYRVFRGQLEELAEERHHALCAFPAVALHPRKLVGKEVVEDLRAQHFRGDPGFC